MAMSGVPVFPLVATPEGDRGPAATIDPTACPECDGSGEVTAMTSHLGPDDHEFQTECPHCGGSGELSDAYTGVVKLLETKERQYSDACGQLWASAHCRRDMRGWRYRTKGAESWQYTEEREVIGEAVRAGAETEALYPPWSQESIGRPAPGPFTKLAEAEETIRRLTAALREATEAPTFDPIAATIQQATEPRVTRIEFASGHEDEAITEQGVAAKLRLMKAAGAMHAALLVARSVIHEDRTHLADAHMNPITNEVDEDGAAGVAEYDAALAKINAALAEAEGRSPQEAA